MHSDLSGHEMSLLNRQYELMTSRQLVLVRFSIHCAVDLRVGNHLDNLQLVRHTS